MTERASGQFSLLTQHQSELVTVLSYYFYSSVTSCVFITNVLVSVLVL